MKGHGLTPSGKARKAFLDEAPASLPPRKFWKNWYFIPVILFFLGGLVAVLLFMNENSSQEAVRNLQEAAGIQELPTNIQEQTTTIHQPAAHIQEPTAHIQEPTAHIQEQSSNFQPLTTTIEEPESDIPQPGANSYEPTTNIQEPTTNAQPLATTVGKQISEIQEPSANTQEPAINSQQPESITQEPAVISQQPAAIIQEPAANNDQPLPWRVAISAYYNPELMFNTLEGNKPVNNFGIEAIFSLGLVSLRTGVGLSISKGITENAVNYNDYLGAYNKLDSMAFTFNEELNNFEPEFYMSSEKVWDSVPQSDSTEIIKRYTYLQVPLVLGFDFWQKGMISIGVRVGTIMSVLLKSHQLTGAYDPGESLVIGVSQLTPSRVSTNWQAVGGFDVSAALTRRIGLEIEPQAR